MLLRPLVRAVRLGGWREAALGARTSFGELGVLFHTCSYKGAGLPHWRHSCDVTSAVSSLQIAGFILLLSNEERALLGEITPRSGSQRLPQRI
jgi:hypothetical protein